MKGLTQDKYISFIEGDKDGEIDCVMIRIIDDSDFERSIEPFFAVIDGSVVTRENALDGFSLLTIIDMRGKDSLLQLTCVSELKLMC